MASWDGSPCLRERARGLAGRYPRVKTGDLKLIAKLGERLMEDRRKMGHREHAGRMTAGKGGDCVVPGEAIGDHSVIQYRLKSTKSGAMTD